MLESGKSVTGLGDDDDEEGGTMQVPYVPQAENEFDFSAFQVPTEDLPEMFKDSGEEEVEDREENTDNYDDDEKNPEAEDSDE